MVKISRSWLSFSLVLSLFALPGLSLVFEDAEAPDAVNPLLERDMEQSEGAIYSYLDRLGKDSYYWTGMQNGHKTLANLTVDVGDDEANIVSMEKFRHLLKSIDCSQNGMTVEFDDARAFGYTQKGWQWVNDDDDRKLVLVAGKKHCGWNTYRTPFIISSIAFDKDSLKAKMTGVPSSWKKLFRNSELTIGKAPDSDAQKHDKRGVWDPEASLNFEHEIPLSQSFPIPRTDVSFDVSCKDCKTTGSFDFGAHIKADWGGLQEASLTLSPNDVSVRFTPRIGLSGNMTRSAGKEWELISIPVDGVNIPGGVFELGPQVVLSFGFRIDHVNGTAGISAGAIVSLKESADLEINLLDPDVSASGWTPEIEGVPPTVDASIWTSAEVYVKAAVELSASIFEWGYQAGVNLEPYFGADIKASSIGSINVGAKVLGVDMKAGAAADTRACITPKTGVRLNVDVANVDAPEDPIVEQDLANISASMGSKCFDFGPTASVGVGSSSKKHAPSSTRATSSSHKASSSTVSSTTTHSTTSSRSSSTPHSSSATPTPHHHHRRYARHGRH